MHKFQIITITCMFLAGTMALLTGCSNPKSNTTIDSPSTSSRPSEAVGHTDSPTPNNPAYEGREGTDKEDVVQVVAKPEDIAVLVNKKIMLPGNYMPTDLVEPNVPFVFKEKDEKRLMRKEAAQALEKLFTGAKQDGIFLAGVSAYRSYATQRSLFDYYIQTQGEEKARRYSAQPGRSEHQTGLAIDVSDSKGTCAAEDFFADTPEAKWLAKHAPEYGFILRYPKDKELSLIHI